MAKKTDFDSKLGELVRDHVEELVGAITAAVRQNMADELQAYLSGSNGAVLKLKKLVKPKKKRLIACIAPGCSNLSKGPRFHYLCDKHRDAPKKDYESWRKAKKTQQAAA